MPDNPDIYIYFFWGGGGGAQTVDAESKLEYQEIKRVSSGG